MDGAFADTLRDVPAESGESVEAAYYRRWLLALETIVARKSLASVEEMAQRKEEWRHAYLRTPHGLPVELKKGPAIEARTTFTIMVMIIVRRRGRHPLQ